MKKCKAFAFSLFAVLMIGLSSCEDKQSISIADNVVISNDDIIVEIDFGQLTKKSNINKYFTEEVKNDLFYGDQDAEELFNNLTDANGKGAINTSAKAYVIVQPKQQRVFAHIAIKDANEFEKLFTQNEDIKEIPSVIDGFKAFSIASENTILYFNNKRALFIQSPTEVDVKAYFESTNTLTKSIVASEINSKNNDILVLGTYGTIIDTYTKFLNQSASLSAGLNMEKTLNNLYPESAKEAYFAVTISFEKGEVDTSFKTIYSSKDQEQAMQEIVVFKDLNNTFTKYISSKAIFSINAGMEGIKYVKNLDAVEEMNEVLGSQTTNSLDKQTINKLFTVYSNFIKEINGDVCLTINDIEVSMFAQKVNLFIYAEGNSDKLLSTFKEILTSTKVPFNTINEKLYSINIPGMHIDLFFGINEHGIAFATNKDNVINPQNAKPDITATSIYSKKDKVGFSFINFNEIFSNETIGQMLKMITGSKYAFLAELDYLKFGLENSYSFNATLKVKDNNINILELIIKKSLDDN